MPLHPDIEAFLELAEFSRLSGKSQPMHEMPVARARSEFEQTSPLFDSDPPRALQVENLAYPARDGYPLRARLYRKPEATSPQAALLFFHGGGYVVGSLDSHDALCRRLALTGDFAVFSADYRLAPEWRFPTAVFDALDSANWLAEHASSLGLDNQRIAFAGDSVGASLATVLAIHARQHPGKLALQPRAQLLLYPVTDASTWRASHAQHGEGRLLESDTLEWFYRHYMEEEAGRLDWRVSPLLTQDLQGLAPAFVSLAEYDPLYDEGLAYAERLQAAGNEVVVRIHHGLTHDFMRMADLLADVQDIRGEMARWLTSKLGSIKV
ncbi:alpha/beta hydrolase [Pseudomonas sp. RIT-PI-AD]|uniref:alpha/beta hydrolase n=1 Tax=Pseudomonas sp. RIT-PI-AD TaxID=3035294 RepID=UPI0021D83FAF|nr:alpha/beta hydrolase [Pseudomonas sp. RIT-PI-AD]